MARVISICYKVIVSPWYTYNDFLQAFFPYVCLFLFFLGVVPDVNIVPVNISYEKVKTKNSDVGTCLAFLLNDLINLRRNTLTPMRS